MSDLTVYLVVGAIAVATISLTVLAMRAEIRDAARIANEQREKALLAPHAKWVDQHDIDRRFNAIAEELRAGAE